MTATLAFDQYPTDALMRVTQRPEAVFVRGLGSWLWDSTGQRYLDFVQGWAVNALGHAPALITETLVHQAGRLMHTGPGFYNDQAIALAAELTRLSCLDRVFFTNSGAEANEGAIKLARKWGQLHRRGASTILSFGNSFHGRTLATMAASGKPGFDRLFPPALPGFVKLPYNDLAAVEAAIDGHTVAVMLELVQGEAGVVEAEPAFVQGLRRLCDQHGLLLMIDEVQTGIGRCGPLFLHSAYGVRPDVVTLGKGLGGGVPIGALLAREATSCFAPGDQGGTYNGNALVCAVGLAVLQQVARPAFGATVQARGEQLAQGLHELSKRHQLGAVRGQGLLRALDVPGDAAPAIVAALRQRADAKRPGLLLNAARPGTLRFMPALNVGSGEVELALAMLDEVLAELTVCGG
ncbi:aminotransferase class III-fold pyridoxal phosphate-dependent enzyme [Aquincola sp. S2]|uniref:Aminotransferase class III-fold pyridoxal phosphate-dependent enzyme n=1 Tax=Pseudaquabacterium terrae TaxID=2732868 RepID=A0ABX2EHF7_9BURK|nr:aminotransferase class III-fold pyridoxal phosphate-dependent enzyme [Aquabacterium terrae]NRF68054.1 aminotransferase class III-fold pyridoxal phosphate-dependent enzyme [Aquabacterium terrae]